MSAPLSPGPMAGIEGQEATPPTAGLTSLAHVNETQAIPSSTTDRWELGYDYHPERPQSVRNRAQMSGDYGSQLIPDGLYGPEIVATIPWLLTTEGWVSTNQYKIKDYKDFTKRMLEAYTSMLLERELWTGEIAAAEGLPNRVFTETDVVGLAGSTTVDPQKAVAILAAEMANAGITNGMIHVPKSLGLLLPPQWTNEMLSEMYGIVIVAGNGYVATDNKIFGTAKVNVNLSGIISIPEDEGEALDRRTNTLTYFAERFGAIDFEGPIFSCNVPSVT